MLSVLTMMDAVNLEVKANQFIALTSLACLRSFLFFVTAQRWDGFLDVEILVWCLMSWRCCFCIEAEADADGQVVVEDNVDDGADGLHPYGC